MENHQRIMYQIQLCAIIVFDSIGAIESSKVRGTDDMVVSTDECDALILFSIFLRPMGTYDQLFQ